LGAGFGTGCIAAEGYGGDREDGEKNKRSKRMKSDENVMHDYYEMKLRIMGYGNPDAPIWFVGMEDGCNSDDGAPNFEEMKEKCREWEKTKNVVQPICKCQIKSEGTSIYRYMGYILGKGCNSPNGPWDFLFDGNDKARYFQMNILPLPRRTNGQWPTIYKNKFKSFREYKDDVHNRRYPIMREFWEKKRPKVIICFGKTLWNEFACLIDDNSPKSLNAEIWCPFDKAGKIMKHKNKTIFLTYFFSARGLGRPENLQPIVDSLKSNSC